MNRKSLARTRHPRNVVVFLAVFLGYICLLLHGLKPQSNLPAVIDISLYAFSIVGIHRPTISLVTYPLAVIALSFTPSHWIYLGEYAVFIPLIWRSSAVKLYWWLLYSITITVALTYFQYSAEGLSPIRALDAFVGWSVFAAICWIISIHFQTVEKLYEQAKRAAVESERIALIGESREVISGGIHLILMRCKQAGTRGIVHNMDIEYISGMVGDLGNELLTMQRIIRRSYSPDEVVSAIEYLYQPLTTTIDSCVDILQRRGFDASRIVDGNCLELRRGLVLTLAKILKDATRTIVKYGDPVAPCSLALIVDLRSIELVLSCAPSSDSCKTSKSLFETKAVAERVISLGGRITSELEPGNCTARVHIPLSE